jgi:FkbM family methyltransferase
MKQSTENLLGKSFNGQYLQDMIAYLFLQGKKDGFYIDIGAHNGITINNTYIFEQLGWKGVCVEPMPDIYLQLWKNRKCDLINAAIADKNVNDADFVRVLGPDMLSGLDSEMLDSHRERIKKENGIVESIRVNTITFDTLMQNYPDVTHVDFLSIDVEGGEISILKTINFNKYSFGIITIENNEPGNVLIELMQNKGYQILCKSGGDIMFIKQQMA